MIDFIVNCTVKNSAFLCSFGTKIHDTFRFFIQTRVTTFMSKCVNTRGHVTYIDTVNK